MERSTTVLLVIYSHYHHRGSYHSDSECTIDLNHPVVSGSQWSFTAGSTDLHDPDRKQQRGHGRICE